MNHPRILGIGTANPAVRFTQEQSFHAAGYQGERIRKIFLNSDIDYRHFYLEGALNREESSDQLNQRYLRGAMKTGLPRDSELCESSRYYSARCRFPCSLHGYVCPDVGSRLIAHMGFSNAQLDVLHPCDRPAVAANRSRSPRRISPTRAGLHFHRFGLCARLYLSFRQGWSDAWRRTNGGGETRPLGCRSVAGH